MKDREKALELARKHLAANAHAYVEEMHRTICSALLSAHAELEAMRLTEEDETGLRLAATIIRLEHRIASRTPGSVGQLQCEAALAAIDRLTKAQP